MDSRRRVNSAVGPHNSTMTETKANVAIVVDPDFGDRLVSLAKEMPVWIADTPNNRPVVESLWSRHDSNVTTFQVVGTDAAEWCRNIIGQIHLHHGEYSQSPPYNSVEVFGVGVTPNLRRAF